MRKNSTPAIGAFHPFIFMLLVYVISLFLSVYVCRFVYYSVHSDGSDLSSVNAKMEHATALK